MPKATSAAERPVRGGGFTRVIIRDDRLKVECETASGGTLMSTYGGKQLAQSFRTVRGNTLKIAEEIPEDQYDFHATPDTRSIRQLLAHIAFGHRFQQIMHQIERRKTVEGFD